ncbi:hypothetical protein [Roseinatronobacter domitianus]|nr:hypothetical protein [Roseibaca domitiana]
MSAPSRISLPFALILAAHALGAGAAVLGLCLAALHRGTFLSRVI